MNLSSNSVNLNKVPVTSARVVCHNDILTVADRSFRIEFHGGNHNRVLQLVSNVWLIHVFVLEKHFLSKLILIMQRVVSVSCCIH